MIKFLKTIALLLLPVLPAATEAQHIVTDTILPQRIVVKSSQYGIATLNNLDTYLSTQEFTGAALHYSHEKFRDAKTGNYNWKYQTLMNGTIGYATQENNLELTALASYSWGGYHPFGISDRLKILAGPQLQIEGGALYIPSNGNNPVQVKLRTALAASAMAIYHFPIKGGDCVARYQLDVPLLGAMFAPEFGQSYYEIFGLGHTGGVIAFTHPFNNPSWRHTLSLDFPLRYKSHSTTIRVAYCADFYQTDINSIRCHIYRHAFTFGFVKTIFKVKEENRIKAYSPY